MALRMRLQLKGCRNRPFFNIVVAHNRRMKKRDPEFVEQLGFYDPLQNSIGSKVVGLDVRRIRYWLGVGVDLTPGVAHLLGLSGVTPVYPPSLALAKKRREKRAELEKKLQEREREMKEKAEKEKVMEEEKAEKERVMEEEKAEEEKVMEEKAEEEKVMEEKVMKEEEKVDSEAQPESKDSDPDSTL